MPSWTEDTIIEAIKRWHAERGRPPRITEWRNEDDWPSPSQVIKAFGTWGEGIAAAGFEAPPGPPRGPRGPRSPKATSPEQLAIDAKIAEIAELIVHEAISTFETRLRAAMQQAFQKVGPQ